MAMLGKKVRMSRLVNAKSNKMMAITVDHAISRGIAPMTGLHQIQNTIDKINLGKAGCNDDDKGNRGTLHVGPCGPGGNVDEGLQLFASGAHKGYSIRECGRGDSYGG